MVSAAAGDTPAERQQQSVNSSSEEQLRSCPRRGRRPGSEGSPTPRSSRQRLSLSSQRVRTRSKRHKLNETANENVFLFVPNLVGYTRVILAAVSLTYMSYHPKYCTVAYIVSSLLDAVDGVAARALGQTSRFGAVLDMVTDRCATACLLCFLSSAYPRCALLFQALITLDFSSHYIHMYSAFVAGSKSHKSVTAAHSWILWSYYNNSRTLFLICGGNELFFICLYLMNSYHRPIGLPVSTWLAVLPSGIVKNTPMPVWTRLQQLTWPQLIAAISFPVFLLKQFINIVQFYKASKHLADTDREERWVKKFGQTPPQINATSPTGQRLKLP